MLDMTFPSEPHSDTFDRRVHPRVRLARPCKVHDPRTGKYHHAQTRDLSAGGMLLEIDKPLALKPGDELYVGIAQKRRQVLLRASEMVCIRIVRVFEALSGKTMLAGCWEDASMPASELRKAA